MLYTYLYLSLYLSLSLYNIFLSHSIFLSLYISISMPPYFLSLMIYTSPSYISITLPSSRHLMFSRNIFECLCLLFVAGVRCARRALLPCAPYTTPASIAGTHISLSVYICIYIYLVTDGKNYILLPSFLFYYLYTRSGF